MIGGGFQEITRADEEKSGVQVFRLEGCNGVVNGSICHEVAAGDV